MCCRGNTCSVGGTIAASTPTVSSRQLISSILKAILQAIAACVAAINQANCEDQSEAERAVSCCQRKSTARDACPLGESDRRIYWRVLGVADEKGYCLINPCMCLLLHDGACWMQTSRGLEICQHSI